MSEEKTGLRKTLIEYIDNISITNSSVFNDQNHLDNFLNYLFRTDSSQKNTNDETPLNQYFLISDLFSGAATTLPNLKERTNKKNALIKIMKSNKKATYKTYESDILYFDFQDEFYDEFNELSDEQKTLVCQMLIAHGLKMFTEYIKANRKKETTLALVLHADQGDFHVHRLYGLNK